jgi:hypothetical protein
MSKISGNYLILDKYFAMKITVFVFFSNWLAAYNEKKNSDAAQLHNRQPNKDNVLLQTCGLTQRINASSQDKPSMRYLNRQNTSCRQVIYVSTLQHT